MNTPDWAPFDVAPTGERGDPPRSLSTTEGVGDRLRAAAFAELQAREAFLWASDFFQDAPQGLRNAWRALASEEDKHLGWLVARLKELGIGVRERRVSDQLWISLINCTDARDFAFFMASAEDRGRKAGERFYQEILQRDQKTAELFKTIALEEVEHIRLAGQYYT